MTSSATMCTGALTRGQQPSEGFEHGGGAEQRQHPSYMLKTSMKSADEERTVVTSGDRERCCCPNSERKVVWTRALAATAQALDLLK